jgi:hypothetical protein
MRVYKEGDWIALLRDRESRPCNCSIAPRYHYVIASVGVWRDGLF